MLAEETNVVEKDELIVGGVQVSTSVNSPVDVHWSTWMEFGFRRYSEEEIVEYVSACADEHSLDRDLIVGWHSRIFHYCFRNVVKAHARRRIGSVFRQWAIRASDQLGHHWICSPYVA